jgi:hypothetical protein
MWKGTSVFFRYRWMNSAVRWSSHWNNGYSFLSATQTHSYTNTTETFAQDFPETSAPQKPSIKRFYDKFKATGSVADVPRSGRPTTMLTEEKVTDIQASITVSLRKSLRRLSQQSGYLWVLHTQLLEKTAPVSLQGPCHARIAAKWPRPLYTILSMVHGACDSRWRIVRQWVLDGWIVVSFEWLHQCPTQAHMVSRKSPYLTQSAPS